MNIGISVIICCYNSASRLPDTLNHLVQQVTSNRFTWEIILVDNNSVDETDLIANQNKKKLSDSGIDIRIVKEYKQGIGHARRRGAEEANHEYIIFCDDDNWLSPYYVATAIDLLSNNPKIGAFGGQSTAISNIPLPDWFESQKQNYAVGKQGESSGKVNSRGHLWTAGMVTRKSLFTNATSDEYPLMLTGRNGGRLNSGEDFEYCQRLLLQNYDIFYCEELKFQHFIPEFRLTEEYNERLCQGFAESMPYLNKYLEALHIKNQHNSVKLRMLISAFRNLIWSCITQKPMREFSIKTLFYFLGMFPEQNNHLKVIKHFYDA